MELNHEQINKLTSFLEEEDIGVDKIEEIIKNIGKVGGGPVEAEASSRFSNNDIELLIKYEKDWKKKASLRALLISKSLE